MERQRSPLSDTATLPEHCDIAFGRIPVDVDILEHKIADLGYMEAHAKFEMNGDPLGGCEVLTAEKKIAFLVGKPVHIRSGVVSEFDVHVLDDGVLVKREVAVHDMEIPLLAGDREIRPGKRLENRNKIPGDIPFVGASDSNNGITGFVGNVNESLDGNTLGVSYNGAPCIAFYHPYECIFTDDVKHLHLKDYDDNEYVHLFLATVVGMQRVKYSYGYKFNEQRMKKQIVMLPMTDNGNPDYEYMEAYIRSKESMLLRRYYDYAEAKSSDRFGRSWLPDTMSGRICGIRNGSRMA